MSISALIAFAGKPEGCAIGQGDPEGQLVGTTQEFLQAGLEIPSNASTTGSALSPFPKTMRSRSGGPERFANAWA